MLEVISIKQYNWIKRMNYNIKRINIDMKYIGYSDNVSQFKIN